MLKTYQIENFKAFAGPETANFSPITVIYGANSSGKSSLLQSLLLLKQSIEEPENNEILLLLKGRLVDLGGYREFIHRHEPENQFSFKVTFPWVEGSEPPGIRELPKPIKPTTLSLCISFFLEQSSSLIRLAELSLFLGNDVSPIATYKPKTVENKSKLQRRISYGHAGFTKRPQTVLMISDINKNHSFWKDYWEHVDSKATKLQLRTVGAKITKIEKEQVNNDKSKSLKSKQLNALKSTQKKLKRHSFEVALENYQKQNLKFFLACKNYLPFASGEMLSVNEKPTPWDFTKSLPDLSALTLYASSLFRDFLSSIVYLGPLRNNPERHYIYSGNLTDQVGKTGRYVPDTLFKDVDLLAKVNQQFEKFKLDYELRVSCVGDEDHDLHDVFSLSLQDKRTGIRANILDVGFGISQVLPLIVQSMLSRGKTLCVEQPEIHLHPRLQAEIASLMATGIAEPYNNRFIIETHSEHLMLRLQRLIRDKVLRSQDVSVIYIDRSTDAARCIRLRIDEEGDFIDNWPDGFFEEGYNELFGGIND